MVVKRKGVVVRGCGCLELCIDEVGCVRCGKWKQGICNGEEGVLIGWLVAWEGRCWWDRLIMVVCGCEGGMWLLVGGMGLER